jgi:SecD/SecF fusion protein
MTDYAAAEKLASQIRIGGLKLELEELRSNVVGAQLGQEAISTSLMAAAIGIGLVIIFMVVLFNIPGLCASFGLLMYVGLMIFLLNAFEITLTLPGIAGIILSIGMAVDANVIIYTRIREEIGNGKTVKSAIDSGYHKALSAIIDGNLTTVIAAIVLGLKGTGSIRGFAITLGLGVCLSMFTALTISRLIMKAFFAIGIKDEKWYGSKTEKKPFDFIKIGGVSFAICVVLIIGGFVVMGVNGGRGIGAMNYSLEFQGGTSTNITFNEDLSIAELEADVIPVFVEVVGEGDIQKQKVSGTNQVIVKTRTLTQDEREIVTTELMDKFSIEETAIQTESISSTIGAEMRRDALVAVGIAIVCMLAYIWLRFKDIRFASAAVLALLYDVLIVAAFYAVSRISVGGTFIACLLTLIGYSINNTIIIFDRIREHLHEMKKKDDYKELVNRSITQTTTRCIYSSTTVLITIVMLYILGVPAVKDFALPLIVGIVFGTFTSVFVTGPMWYFFRTKIVKKEK